MREDEFVIRGRSDTGTTEVLNFSGFKRGYAYKLKEFKLYPLVPTSGETLLGTITASKTAMNPDLIDFRDEGLIATAMESYNSAHNDGDININCINDTFLITQNLLLKVTSSSTNDINWQCKFESVKMSEAEAAVANYRQFTISDG